MSAPRPNTVSVRKRLGRYVVDISVATPSGRKRSRQKFHKKSVAEAHAHAVRARLSAGLPPFETDEERRRAVSILEVLLSYKPKTPRGEQHIEAFRGTALAGKAAEAFDLADLDGFVLERETAAGRRLKTCAKDFSFLKRCLAFSKAHGIIASHYFEKLVGDKVTRRRLMPAYRFEDSPGTEIPDEDLEKIFARLERRARRAVLFARSTGCRLMEVAALDWQAHRHQDGFRPIQQKGSRPRVVPYDKQILGDRGIGLVFSELGGTPAEIYKALQAKWRYAVKAAKVRHYRFHDLRHTFGTLLRRDGKSYSDIAAIMGITEAMAHVYAHEDLERIQVEAHGAATSAVVSKLANLA